MTHRECFLRIMAGAATSWTPNYELGCWGQTVQRWLDEGIPGDQMYWNFWQGEPFFKIDRHDYAYLNIGMIPAFEYQVLEETEQYITARYTSGIVTKALKDGTVRGTRMCMDQYIAHPVTDRASWQDVKRRYNPNAPIRYPLFWDELAHIWKKRDYPVCLLGNGSFGVLGDIGVHLYDFASFIVGDIAALQCELKTFNKGLKRIGPYVFDANDSMAAIVRFNNGALGTLHSSRWATGQANTVALRVYGDKGGLDINLDRPAPETLRICVGQDVDTNIWWPVKCPPVPTMYQRFVDALKSGKQGQTSFEGGARVQAYLDASLKSAANGGKLVEIRS